MIGICSNCRHKFKFGNRSFDKVEQISATSYFLKTRCPACGTDIGVEQKVTDLTEKEVHDIEYRLLVEKGLFNYSNDDPLSNPVTVGELIKILSKFPYDLPVVNCASSEYVDEVHYWPEENAVSLQFR